MISYYILFLLCSRFVIAIDSLPDPLTTNNQSQVASPTTKYSCAFSGVAGRANVRAIDCLNLFTFILATEHHASPVTFSLPPGQSGYETVYTRHAGTCELAVIMGRFGQRVNPETVTFDQLLQVGLSIVSNCLLNGEPDDTHWGGVGKINPASNLRIAIAGLKPAVTNGGSANTNSSLDVGMVDWTDIVSES